MKTLTALILAITLTQTAFAQSRSGGGGALGSVKAGKQGVASAKDLNKAARLAGQAESRLSAGGRKPVSRGWVQGGSGWGQGGPGSSKKR